MNEEMPKQGIIVAPDVICPICGERAGDTAHGVHDECLSTKVIETNHKVLESNALVVQSNQTLETAINKLNEILATLAQLATPLQGNVQLSVTSAAKKE